MTPWKRRLLRKALSGLMSSPGWAAASHDRRCALLLSLVERVTEEGRALMLLRDESIRSAFNGCNIRDLATAFGLHPRQIRRIVRPRRRK